MLGAWGPEDLLGTRPGLRPSGALDKKQKGTISMQLIGKGKSAEVFQYNEGKVLKLFFNDFSINDIKYEYLLMSSINQLNINAPMCYGTISLENRNGLLYEYAKGVSLLSLIIQKPLRVKQYAHLLAREHAKMHAHTCTTLPSEKERFSKQIERSKERIGHQYNGLMEQISKVNSETFVYHGDFHPDNILVDNSDISIIDWMNSYSGTRAGDSARTYLMIISPSVPDEFPKALLPMLKILKIKLATTYLNEYQKITGITKKEINSWMKIIAAVRLCDNIPGEEDWLLKIINE